MDENKSPQDILNEIFEKSREAEPPIPQPRFEPPGGDEPPPAPPTEEPTGKRGTETAAKLLPWLGVVLGAALLILGVCILQLARINHRLDGLQEAVEAVRSVDSLRKENEQLQEQLDQAEENSEQLQQALDDTNTRLGTMSARKRRLDYLWYMGQFIDHGDYPMAALAAALSSQSYFPDGVVFGPQVAYPNPEQTAQYRAYTQELIDRGYLETAPAFTYGDRIELSEIPDASSLVFPDQWDPEQNPDMAALGIIWCAMDRYYVLDDPTTAAQWLVEYEDYPIYEKDSLFYENQELFLSELETIPLSQRILDTASEYTVQLYERLIQDLMEEEYVVEQDGALKIGKREGTDLYYILPFVLPFYPAGGYLYGEIPLYGETPVN